MKKIYFSVDWEFEKTEDDPRKLGTYRNTRSILSQLKGQANVVLVHPGDYVEGTSLVRNGYRFVSPSRIARSFGEHEPSGDIFVVYGDESSKGFGTEFARKQYGFLKNLQKKGNFECFVNTPEAEEKTMKDYLIELSDPDVALTYPYKNRDQVESLLYEHGELVIKPIFGSRGLDARKIDDVSDLDIMPEEIFSSECIFQEVLSGDEKRITMLNNEVLCSRIYMDRRNPWNPYGKQITLNYTPTEREIQISERLNKDIGAELIAVDFIGDKVNEINGTSSGLILYDHNGELVYDHTQAFVDRILQLAETI